MINALCNRKAKWTGYSGTDDNYTGYCGTDDKWTSYNRTKRVNRLFIVG